MSSRIFTVTDETTPAELIEAIAWLAQDRDRNADRIDALLDELLERRGP